MMIIDNNDDSYSKNPCKKYRDFTLFLGVEILWKGTVSTWFQANRRNHAEAMPFDKITAPGNQVKLRYFSQ